MAWGLIAGAVAAGAVGSFLSSKEQSEASGDAARLQYKALMESLGFQREQWEDIKGWQEPTSFFGF